MSKKKKLGLGQGILTACMAAYAIICLLPMLLIVVVSFSSDASINSKGFSFFPTEWSLKAWEYVGGYGKQLIVSYGVTIFITVVGTVLGLLVMSMFAYTLSRKCFELRKHLAILMLITMLFSGGQLSTYLVETGMYGMKDSIWALILPGISAMHIIILRTYIQSNVPDALIESAKIDGAGEYRTFWQIVFPMMKPSLASVGFMKAIAIWNDWNKAYLYITSPNKTPLQLLLIRVEKNIDYLIQNQSDIPASEYAEMMKTLPQESGRMAILLTALGPIMIAYPFFQKYFVKGMTMGAVKG
ncbi:MAG: carbohydrate ABC transporter permease [Lachnospiraceae bacterium]|nr:carbohydrate ABC transporter permease [Lachnospiraceae bacterium]